MGNRLTKLYTRTGDKGTTGLADNSRISKSSLRVEAMGAVDELNSQIGLVLSHGVADAIAERLRDIQHDLFDLGGELATPSSQVITPAHCQRLEQAIDHFNADLPPLKEFILPGGNRVGSFCHVARTVCRRAERAVIRLHESETLNLHGMVYLNRLSDLLFVFSRLLVRQADGAEVYWQRDRNKS